MPQSERKAEGVLRRPVDAGDAAPREERANRKHFAGRELRKPDAVSAPGRSPRTCLADDITMRRRCADGTRITSPGANP